MNPHKLPVFPDYFTVGVIGTGHYSNVYKVLTRNNKIETFAAKVFRDSRSPQDVLKINREVNILRKLNHKNIVKFVDYVEDHRICYIVLEYCDGGTLKTLITKRKKLDESWTRFLTQQLVRGLNYLSSLSICHMDLKPENLLLTQVPPYSLKIADFGLSQDLSIAKSFSKNAGTVYYMAPEKVLLRECELISDLWSFGVVIRECLTGKLMFGNDTYDEIKLKMAENFPIRDPKCTELSYHCKDFLRSLLQYDPNKRLTLEGVNVHPFVDMQHEICPESYQKATELIKNAMLLDKRYEHSKSVPLYKEALVFLAAFLNIEESNYKKAALNMKIREYERWIQTLEKNPGQKNDIIMVQPLPHLTGAIYEMNESSSEIFTPEELKIAEMLRVNYIHLFLSRLVPFHVSCM